MALFRGYQQLRLDVKRIAYILKHSITRRLLIVVFSIYMLITGTVTILHMDFEYESSKHQTIAALKNIQTMIHDSISQAIWEFNATQLDTILNGLYTNQYIVGIKLEIPQNDTIRDIKDKEVGYVENSAGQLIYIDPQKHHKELITNSFMRLIPNEFDIEHTDAIGRTIIIGKMYLYSSNTVVFRMVKASYILIIVNAIIKTVTLWVFFLWAGYSFISKPLVQLTAAIKQISSGNWNTTLNISNSKRQKTEINILFETFNDMAKNMEQMQAKLKSSRNRLNNIFDTMPSALAAVNNKSIIQGWNKFMVQLTGINSKEAIGNNILNVFPEFTEYAYLINDVLKSNTEQQVKHVKLTRDKNNEQRLFHITVYPVKSIYPPEAVIRIDDVTEQIKAEAGMAQVEKLASVGASIAGVAHEINNPLGSIMQSTQNILRRIDPNMESNKQQAMKLNIDLQNQYEYLKQREIISFLNVIHQAGERASSIVKNMLKFTRRSTADMSKHDIIDIINDAIQLSSSDISIQEHIDFKEIKINRLFNVAELTIECFPLEIQQVLLNLIRNAVQSIDPLQPQKIINIELSKIWDNKIAISISDNGHGMSTEVIEQIYQPFFTTKPAGQGTGLGLSVCKNIIVQKHHGNLEVKSEVAVGTTFIITLPIQQPRNL